MFNCEKSLNKILVLAASGIYTQHSSPAREKKKSKVPKWLFEPEMEGIVHEIFKKKKKFAFQKG